MINLTEFFKRLVALTILSVVVGCGAQTGDISGAVSFEGKKLPAGRITFICEGGDKPVLMSSITDGAYVIVNAPVGPAQVTVETFEITTTAVPNMIESPLPPDQQNDVAAKSDYVKIPAHYKAPTTSGLTYEIVAGNQTHDLNLTSE